MSFVDGLLLTGDVQRTTVTLSSRRQPRRLLRHRSSINAATAAAAAAAATFQRGCIFFKVAAAAFGLCAVLCSGVLVLKRAVAAQNV